MKIEKESILRMILQKINEIENKPGRTKLIVDTIDIAVLKELYNDIQEKYSG